MATDAVVTPPPDQTTSLSLVPNGDRKAVEVNGNNDVVELPVNFGVQDSVLSMHALVNEATVDKEEQLEKESVSIVKDGGDKNHRISRDDLVSDNQILSDIEETATGTNNKLDGWLSPSETPVEAGHTASENGEEKPKYSSVIPHKSSVSVPNSPGISAANRKPSIRRASGSDAYSPMPPTQAPTRRVSLNAAHAETLHNTPGTGNTAITTVPSPHKVRIAQDSGSPTDAVGPRHSKGSADKWDKDIEPEFQRSNANTPSTMRDTHQHHHVAIHHQLHSLRMTASPGFESPFPEDDKFSKSTLFSHVFSMSVKKKGKPKSQPMASCHSKALEGDHRGLLAMLTSKGGPNVVDPENFTETCVQVLLEQGANVSLKSKQEWTPLHLAARNGHVECMELLVQASADVNVRDKNLATPLHNACGPANSREAVEYLIKMGADVAAQDKDLWSALHYATRFNNTDIMELLLNKGADPNVQDVDGWTPLHNSARNGRQKCVQILIEGKADLCKVTKYGETAMHVGCRKGKAKVVSFFVTHCVESGLLDQILNMEDKDKQKPENVAASEDIKKILRREDREAMSFTPESNQSGESSVQGSVSWKSRLCCIS